MASDGYELPLPHVVRARRPRADADAGTDEDLVRAAQRGSRASFECLYRRHGRLVHGVLLAKVPTAAADDLVQEVFLQAWHKLGQLRAPDAFRGWLVAMARRRAVDFHRSRRRTSPLDPAVTDPRAHTEEALRVVDLIQSLPESYVEPLMLRLIEGMSGREIADATGLTHGSVRINLSRGYALLRARMEETP